MFIRFKNSKKLYERFDYEALFEYLVCGLFGLTVLMFFVPV